MTLTKDHLFPGVPLALGSALLFGAIPPLSKLLLANIDPLPLAGTLYLGAGVGLAGYAAIQSRPSRKQEAPLRGRELPWFIAAVVLGGIIAPVLLVYGLARTSASNGSLLLNLEGLATMAIAWLVFRENVDRRLLIGAAAILAGAVALTWQGQGFSLDVGGLFIAGACLAWGIDNNLTRKVSAADPVVIAMIKGLVAGGVNLGLAWWIGASIQGFGVWLAACLLGFLGVGVSLVMFVKALRYLGTARTGAYYSTAPFIGASLSVLLLGDPITSRLIIAAALMGVGLYLHVTETHAHAHDHEALEHEHSHVHDEHHQHHHDEPVIEPHSHWHRHEPMRHSHVHYPDLHHQHRH